MTATPPTLTHSHTAAKPRAAACPGHENFSKVPRQFFKSQPSLGAIWLNRNDLKVGQHSKTTAPKTGTLVGNLRSQSAGQNSSPESKRVSFRSQITDQICWRTRGENLRPLTPRKLSKNFAQQATHQLTIGNFCHRSSGQINSPDSKGGSFRPQLTKQNNKQTKGENLRHQNR